MRCHICDAQLSDDEVQWSRDHEDWEPCRKCLTVIGEVFEPLPEERVTELLEVELMEFGYLPDTEEEVEEDGFD